MEKIKDISVSENNVFLQGESGVSYGISVHLDEADFIKKLLGKLNNNRINPVWKHDLLDGFLRVKKADIGAKNVNALLKSFLGSEEKLVPEDKKVLISKVSDEMWCASFYCGKRYGYITPGSSVAIALIKEIPIFIRTELTEKQKKALYVLTRFSHLQKDAHPNSRGSEEY